MGGGEPREGGFLEDRDVFQSFNYPSGFAGLHCVSPVTTEIQARLKSPHE